MSAVNPNLLPTNNGGSEGAPMGEGVFYVEKVVHPRGDEGLARIGVPPTYETVQLIPVSVSQAA